MADHEHRPAGGEVVADGAYDRVELERFVQRRVDVDTPTVAAVLDLYDEYLAAVGIADPPPDGRYEHYDPATLAGEQGVADPGRVASDAPGYLGIAEEVAGAVLEAEFAYLQAKGLA